MASAGKKVVLFTPGETVAYERRVHEVSARLFPVPLEKPLEVHILVCFDPDAKISYKKNRRVKKGKPA